MASVAKFIVLREHISFVFLFVFITEGFFFFKYNITHELKSVRMKTNHVHVSNTDKF